MPRRGPVLALAVVLAAGAAIPFSNPFALVALWPLYLIARADGPRAGALAVAAVAVTYLAHDLVWLGEIQLPALLVTLAICGAAVAFGLSAGVRRAAAARERELLTGQAAAEERLRIARELHDAVGHDVSLMVVQAQALGATSADPAVREGTDAIAALGRRTMAEMHRTLRVLRDDAALAPSPGLDAVDEVLDGARAAGVALTYAVEGAPRALAPALDASAYRIVQEAVTNVIRHAGGAPAAVTVRYGADALELHVTDEGPGPAANGTAPGHGLVGMRERAALFGGTLTAAAARDGRGFAVHAVLPYGAER